MPAGSCSALAPQASRRSGPLRRAHAARPLEGWAVDLDGLRAEGCPLCEELVAQVDDGAEAFSSGLSHTAAYAPPKQACVAPEGGGHERHRDERPT